MPINFICDKREKAVKEYEEVVSKLERASQIPNEIESLNETISFLHNISVPTFGEYCKRFNFPIMSDFSFPTFSEYCSKRGIKKSASKPKYGLNFWDDAEKTFKYKYFRYVYGFYIAMFVDRSEEEKYNKCRDKYKNTKVEEFFKDLGKRKANIFSRIHKVPRQYYKEFLNLINELKNESINEWNEYEAKSISAPKEFEEAKKQYEQELNKAKEDYKTFVEDYYSKNAIKEKYEEECSRCRIEKEREKKFLEERNKLEREFEGILSEIDKRITPKNLDYVLSYIKKSYADTVKDLLEEAFMIEFRNKLADLAKWRYEGDKTYLADIVVFGKTEQITVKARNSSDAIDRIHSVSPSIRIEKIIGDNSI